MFYFLVALPFLIIAAALLVVVSGKAEADPEHERPRAIYLASASYVAALVLITASFFVVQGGLRSIAGGFIAGVAGAATFAFHRPKLAEYETTPAGPGARVYARYLYLVCFASAVVAAAAIATAAYQLLATVAPATLGNGDRGDALRSTATALGLALVPALLFVRHWSAADNLQTARKAAAPAE